MPRREHKYMFWTDLETTGSDLDAPSAYNGEPTKQHILEVGAAITDMQLNVLDTRDLVLHFIPVFENIKPVVVEMHQKNGLWRDAARSGMSIQQADNILSEWIKQYNGPNHMLFAGSGVAHFDRKWFKRDLPLTDKRLTHYAIDVGVIRRTFDMFLGIGDEWPEDGKTHRGLDDILFHIEEFKWALDKMRKGV
jgi:oligoribonuclease